MAFDPKVYLKSKESGASGGFDPKAYLASKAINKEDSSINSEFDQEPITLSDEQKKLISNQQIAKKEKEDHIKAHENDGVLDKIKDPARWQAILNNTGPYAQDVVAGTAPMAIPAGAIPKLGQAASALANGQGVGFAAARTALSGVQGAVMNAFDGNSGDSIGEKIEHIKDGAKLSGGIQLAAESIPYVGKILGAASRKVSSALSGESENIISNYAKRTDDVNKIIKQSGGDMTAAADQARTELSAGIQKTKSGLNSQIAKTLEGSNPEVKISINHIIESLEETKSKLNPNFKNSAINEIDEMISSIKSEAPDGMANAKSLYQIKQFLNEGSSSAYNKGGQIFTRASEAARAAKEASRGARETLKEIAPEISVADQQLSKLHQIESRLNKNLLTPGKPDGALFAAGAGDNLRNAATLRELERVSGVPISQKALDLATARSFANPSIMPTGTTGKTVGRMVLGAGAGYLMDGEKGAAIGAGLSSPFALKAGINAMNATKGVTSLVPKVGKLIRENPVASQAIIKAISSAKPGNNLKKDDESIKEIHSLLQNSPKNNERETASINPKNLKGEQKWAYQGIKKLGIDESKHEELMNNKKYKRLLIEASDLPIGSKKLDLIKKQIKELEQ